MLPMRFVQRTRLDVGRELRLPRREVLRLKGKRPETIHPRVLATTPIKLRTDPHLFTIIAKCEIGYFGAFNSGSGRVAGDGS